jgi:HlyD family secretion protein
MINKIMFVFIVFTASCGGPPRATGAYQGIVEHEEWTLGFEVPGRVVTVAVDPGAQVNEGALIAKLDETLAKPLRDARAEEVRAAEAQLDLLKAGVRAEDRRATEAQLEAARSNEAVLGRNLNRQRDLLKQGATTPAAVDELEGRLDRARGDRQALEERLNVMKRGARREDLDAAAAKLAAARAALVAEEERLARYTLSAPRESFVVDTLVLPGEVVLAGSPVAVLADTHRPFVDIYVPEASVSSFTVGAPAQVRVDGVAEPFAGKVEVIGRKTEFTPRFLFSERERPNLVVRVRVRVDDPGAKLHAGLPAFVDVGGAS